MKPVRSILAAVDFTPCSANALRHAIRLAGSFEAQVRVLHVVDTLVVLGNQAARSPRQEQMEAQLRAEADAAWRQFAARIPGAGGLPFEIAVNNRTAGIVESARAHHADLLVVGAFGQRKPDVGVGSVASACVRQSPCDVLLVRDTLEQKFQRIVCAVDFSDTARLALQKAAALAAREGAELHVLHVFNPPWNRLTGVESAMFDQAFQAEHRATVEQQLETFAADVIKATPEVRITTFCYDKAGHRSAINEYAGSIKADLVVLGTRGRSTLRTLLLGTTAEKTLARSACSVLAVKPTDAG